MFIVVVFIGLCISSWFTQVLGLHAFFGGFIFGVCVPKQDREWNAELIHQLEVVIVNFFVPIFFCNTGLSTDFSQLKSAAVPIILVTVLATCGKMLPPLLLGRFLRHYSWPFSFQLASLMNARGLVELIALTIAKESGAFNMKMYSVFVIMALTTTFMSGPMFYLSYDPKKDPPAANRLSRLAQQQDAPQDQPPPLESIACVEIPKDEQLDADGAQFSGYLYTGTLKEEEKLPRNTIVGKVWNESGPASRASTTSSVQSSADGVSEKIEGTEIIPEGPEKIPEEEDI